RAVRPRHAVPPLGDRAAERIPGQGLHHGRPTPNLATNAHTRRSKIPHFYGMVQFLGSYGSTSWCTVGNGLLAVPNQAERHGGRSLQNRPNKVLPWFEPCQFFHRNRL